MRNLLLVALAFGLAALAWYTATLAPFPVTASALQRAALEAPHALPRV